MPITRATNLAGLGTIFDSLTDGGGLSVSGISTFTDLNITRVNITGVGTISNGSITNLTGTSSTITTGNFTTGNIVTGVTTNFTSTNGSITNLTGTSSTITTLRSTTGNFTTGNIVTGVTTNFNATNVVITGVTTVSAGTALLPSITPSGDPNTGVFFPAADHLNFSTGGTSRVQIESDGDINIDGGGVFYDATNNRLAIGSTSPDARLTVKSSGASTTLLNVKNSSDTEIFRVFQTAGGGSQTSFKDASGNTNIFIDGGAGQLAIGTIAPTTPLSVRLVSNIATYGNVSANFSDNITGTLYVQHSSGKVQLGSDSALAFGYGVSATEGARIDTSGRLLVGTIASPAHQLQVSTDSAGKPSTNTWTIVSDERIKEEIELADLDLCYEAVKSIPLKRFKWKDEVYTEEQVRDRRKLGWIAQDVEDVFPKAVGTYEFKYNQVFEETIIPAVEEELDVEGNVTTPAQAERIEKGELISEDVIEDCRDLNSDQLYAAMYGAIQKLMAKVETLEAEVAALKAN